MTKKPLDPARKSECDKLKAIFNSKKRDLGLTQEKLAHALDMNQSSVSHYMNGVNPLNAQAAASFAKILGVNVSEFSTRLAAEIEEMASATIAPSHYLGGLTEAEIAEKYATQKADVRDPVCRGVEEDKEPYWVTSFQPGGSGVISGKAADSRLKKPSAKLDTLMRDLATRASLFAEMEALRELDQVVTKDRAHIIAAVFTGIGNHPQKALELFLAVSDALVNGSMGEKEIDALITIARGYGAQKAKDLPQEESKKTG